MPQMIVGKIEFSPGSIDGRSASIYAELSRLRDDNERLRRDCAEAYQVIGAAMLDEPCDYDQTDVVRALDNLSAAANGMPRPHDDLLPWPKQSATTEGL